MGLFTLVHYSFPPSGPISKAIGDLHKLTVLNLYNNKLGGKLNDVSNNT